MQDGSLNRGGRVCNGGRTGSKAGDIHQRPSCRMHRMRGGVQAGVNIGEIAHSIRPQTGVGQGLSG